MPLGERAGLVRYQLNTHKIILLPIPSLSGKQRDNLIELAERITDLARKRYEMKGKTIHRIVQDLKASEGHFNRRLISWWELTFTQFREELVKAFKHDISLKDRDDWEAFLRERAAEIRRLTTEIVRLETQLNEAVYDVFGLSEEERGIIERETKYQYGEW